MECRRDGSPDPISTSVFAVTAFLFAKNIPWNVAGYVVREQKSAIANKNGVTANTDVEIAAEDTNAAPITMDPIKTPLRFRGFRPAGRKFLDFQMMP